MPANDPPLTSPSVSKNETRWLVAAIFVGAIIRLSFPGRMAIEHFDEGVYASNLWFPDQDYSYPARYLYAPPLLPAAIEWTMILASVCGSRLDGFVPIIPCLVAGIAMIPSIWWIVRQWFGPSAGLISAWLVATSDFHACYSRAALTDVPVCLFILWSVYFVGLAFAQVGSTDVNPSFRKTSQSRGIFDRFPWRVAVLAGVLTGLAWWTKYNGWLPLAIGLAGASLWQILVVQSERKIQKTLCCGIFIVLVAAVVWSPVVWGLQKHGGYASVAANHRQYLVGIRGWPDAAVRQLRNIGLYENPLDIFYSPFARRNRWEILGLDEDLVFPASKMDFLPPPNPNFQSFIESIHRTIFKTWGPFFVPVASLVVSAYVCMWNLRNGGRSQLLPISLVAVWFAGMTIATPFYYPYPRLVLPWLCSTWICIGLAFRSWRFEWADDGSKARMSKPLCGIFVAMASISILRLAAGSAFAWQDRTGMHTISRQFADTIKREAKASGFPEFEAFVYVLGEPAIVYGLHAQGLPYVGPISDLSFMEKLLQRPTFIVFSLGSIDSDADREQLLVWRFEGRLQEHPHRSHLVVNESAPKQGKDDNIRLYRQIK